MSVRFFFFNLLNIAWAILKAKFLQSVEAIFDGILLVESFHSFIIIIIIQKVSIIFKLTHHLNSIVYDMAKIQEPSKFWRLCITTTIFMLYKALEFVTYYFVIVNETKIQKKYK
jgi:hypothetical protein